MEEWKISEPLHLWHVTPRGKYLKLWFRFLIFHIQDSKGWTLDGNLVTSYQSDEVFSFDKGKQLTHQPLSDATVAGERERGRDNAVKKHRGTPESSCSCRQHWGMKMHAHSRNSHSGSSSDRNSLASNDGKTPTYIIRPAECHYFNCVSNHVFLLEYVRCDRWKRIRKRAFRPKITKNRHSFGCI